MVTKFNQISQNIYKPDLPDTFCGTLKVSMDFPSNPGPGVMKFDFSGPKYGGRLEKRWKE